MVRVDFAHDKVTGMVTNKKIVRKVELLGTDLEDHYGGRKV